ncbi:MAG TPA: leucine--tRNA ligase, partial [Deltaproteobacteria bacterium]|nr:leucine--tRNA ligase [Deltaproteobacteria bacterium]
EKDLDWSEAGVEGAYRFLGRVYRLVAQRKDALRAAGAAWNETDAVREIRRVTHGTLRKVTRDVEDRFHFNTAISSIMEMVNFLYLVEDAAWTSPETAPPLREAVRILIVMLSPFAPHLSEELWETTGNEGLACRQEWPALDREAALAEEILVVVQVNGKLRSRITVDAGAGEEEIRALAMSDPKVQEFTRDGTIRKVVYVPGKLVNIVL